MIIGDSNLYNAVAEQEVVVGGQRITSDINLSESGLGYYNIRPFELSKIIDRYNPSFLVFGLGTNCVLNQQHDEGLTKSVGLFKEALRHCPVYVVGIPNIKPTGQWGDIIEPGTFNCLLRGAVKKAKDEFRGRHKIRYICSFKNPIFRDDGIHMSNYQEHMDEILAQIPNARQGAFQSREVAQSASLN